MPLFRFAKYSNRFVYSLFIYTLFYSGSVPADGTKENAVYHIQQSVAYCNDAQQAVLDGHLARASALINQFIRIKQQAQDLDNTVLTNPDPRVQDTLRYCSRVVAEIEVANAQPLLTEAFQACEKAEQSFNHGDIAETQALLETFLNKKSQALAVAPTLTDQYRTRRKISDCDNLNTKVVRVEKERTQLNLSFQYLQQQSKAIVDDCTQLSNHYEQQVNELVNYAELQKNADNLMVAQQKLKQNLIELSSRSPSTEEIEHSVRANLTSSQQCISRLQADIVAKQNEIILIQQELKAYQSSLNLSLHHCETLQDADLQEVTTSDYMTAKGDYEKAINSRNSVQSALLENWHYNHKKSWTLVKKLQDSMNELNACLENSRLSLAKLYAATPKSVPSLPRKPASKDGLMGVPAKTINGTIRLLEPSTSFAIVYLIDGSRPNPDVTITLDSNGFEKVVYAAGSGDTYNLINRDQASHQLGVTNPLTDWQSSLGSIRPGQKTTQRVSWPVNHMATLKTDDETINPTYLANIQSNNYQVVLFDFSSNSQAFQLENKNEATHGFLLLPGFDPLKLEVTQGNIKSLVITQQGQPKGNLLLKGL